MEKGKRLIAAATELLIEAKGLAESSETLPLKAETVKDIDKAIEKSTEIAGEDGAKG